MNRFNSTFRIKDRKPMEHAPLHCRRPIKRTRMKVRRPSKVASIDGDSARDIKDECDQLVREILTLRDTLCISCGTGGQLEVGHLHRRGHEPVRWNLQNCNGQHSTCNQSHNENQDAYIEGFVQKYGEAAYHELRALSRSARKLSYVELLETRDGLRAELAGLNSVKLV